MRHVDSANTRSLNSVAGGGRISMVTVRGPAGLGVDGVPADVAMTDVATDPSSLFAQQQAATYAATLDNASTSANGAVAIGKLTKVDATAAARAMTIPDGTIKGQRVVVEKVDSSANAVTVTGKIRSTGSSSESLTSQYETTEFIWGGTYWEPVAGRRTTASLRTAFAEHYASLFLADGDSITAAAVDTTNNVLADSWYTYLTALSDGRLPYVRNSGHGNYSSAALLALLDAEVIAKLPLGGAVIWASGRNDSQTLATVQAADREVLRRCREAGIDVVFCTLAPVGTTALDTPVAPTGTASTTGGTLATASYAYKIVAKNAHGATLPSTGTTVAVTGPTGKVVLTWPHMPGASAYDVYRDDLKVATVSAGSLPVPTPSYTDTGTAAAGAPPASNTTGSAGAGADVIFTGKVNVWRKRFAKAHGCRLIDFHAALADPTTGRYAKGLGGDGTHPTPDGQRAMGVAAWAALSGDVPNARAHIAIDNADPMNGYTNGLFIATGGGPPDRPSGWPGMPNGTDWTSTIGAVTGFLGNAWTVQRLTAAAGTYLGQIDLTLASLGWSVGDVIQVALKVKRTGAGGMTSEHGVRFVSGSNPTNAANWKLTADLTDPTILVGPEVAIPTGTTALRLLKYIYGGPGTVVTGQFTIVNLTLNAVLDVTA